MRPKSHHNYYNNVLQSIYFSNNRCTLNRPLREEMRDLLLLSAPNNKNTGQWI